jgi:starch phosphorylase
VAIQLNDTHPSIGIAEMMRILLDDYGLKWDDAWQVTVGTFSYTNHTLMPEALETWPVDLIGHMLPRILQIIFEINHRFLTDVRRRYPEDHELVKRVSVIDESEGRKVRMANLAFVGSHRVNGVAAIHTELMKTTVFADLHRLFPTRIVNKTNGITPRRWLLHANRGLAELITQHIGDGWVADLSRLKALESLAQDERFQEEFRAVKRANKERLARRYTREVHGTALDVDGMFDVHVKRMHEYKRQLLNLLHVVTRYNRIRSNPSLDIVPRVVVFAGKAAPGYYMAKLIIKLINDVGAFINNDPVMRGRLAVVLLPDYNVSSAEVIIPAAELSEQISTAGTEASGTGNMKLALNGALTIGTRDGANIEIGEEVGEDNLFFFGLTADEVAAARSGKHEPWRYVENNPELRRVLDMIGRGYFSPDEPERFRPVVESLTTFGDYFLLLADYAPYIACQERIDAIYRRPFEWTRRAILNVARIGKFTADRTVKEYAADIWNVGGQAPASARIAS